MNSTCDSSRCPAALISAPRCPSSDQRRSIGGVDAVVCHCHQVRESAIRRAIDVGHAKSVEEISLQTRAGTGCGGCRCKLKRMLAGLSPNCGRFAFCGQCGCVEAICACDAA